MLSIARGTGLSLVLSLFAVSAGAERDLCGSCLDWSAQECQTMQVGSPCHAWDYDDDGMAPRGMDMHMQASSAYLGLGTCAEYHAAPCHSLNTDQIDQFGEAVLAMDSEAAFEAVVGALEARVQFDRSKRVVELSATCRVSGRAAVIARVVVEGDAARYWEGVAATDASDR